MSPRMYLWARYLGQGLCVSTLLLLPAGPAVAQQTIALTSPTSVEAAKLHRQADELLAKSQRRHWKQVAHLLQQAAALRAPDDSLAIDEQLVAAQLFHSTGELAGAQESLEGAARQALANGRVLQSAEALITAAAVAKERRHGEEAVELARRAERLARSPHLTQAECTGVLDRIIWVDKQVAAK